MRRHPDLFAALAWPALLCFLSAVAVPARADTLLLKNGQSLTGSYVQVATLAESLVSPKIPAGGVATTPIVLVDDGMRRTFVHWSHVREVLDTGAAREVRIKVWQNVANQGAGVGRVGPALRVEPFDEFGRRIYELNTPDGRLAVVQGITQITPVYARVESLMGVGRPIKWDMRISMGSIPRETLSRILSQTIKQEDVDERLQVVRLYVQADRYRDARQELEQIIKDFPERADLEQEVRQLRQMGARLILDELDLRAGAGQHQLARALLDQFPSEGVGGEMLQQVSERLAKYAEEDKRRADVAADLRAQLAKIADANGRRPAEPMIDEIIGEMNEDAIGRLASFERLADDTAMSAEQKVALAISGWLVGAAQATDNFQVSLSLVEVRNQVRAYLRDPIAANRQRIAAELRDREGATVERVAQIIRLMRPPLDAPRDAQRGMRNYELAIPGLPGGEDVRYVVQLPPEYDPLRRYPTILALADQGVSPEQMLDFWAGATSGEGGERLGQATRHGYIVIAVDWMQPRQANYEFSVREHHAVLGALRDACRRFAIDTDRVFLTGHGAGGEATFDTALAHPDLWAGAMPFVALAGKYCPYYWTNGQYLAWYVVAGELDGDKMLQNAQKILDRFMRPGFNATVVEYLGRGYEPLGDEVPRIFDWMGRQRRTMPTKFEYVTMRPWDNYFGWVEVQGIPDQSLVMPATWPPKRGQRPFTFKSEVLGNGTLSVTARTEEATIWLSPDLVKFDQAFVVELNTRPIVPRGQFVKPDLDVLLEDVRTRGDRQHPFWAKLPKPTTNDR
jgi:hypothetical protein